MLTATDRLRVPEPEVAARVIDGEAIIINLSTGVYYSLNDVGGAIWALLERGASLGETAAAVVDGYQIPVEQARADVERLALELFQEKLLVRSDHMPSSAPTQLVNGGEVRPYAPPRLDRFDDMAELFAQDPPLPELPDV